MNKDEEIRTGLRAAGVPEGVFSKSLKTENAEPLRELIKTGALIRGPKETVGVFIHPSKRTEAARARTIAYLLAKELFLSGTTVYCIPLIRLMESMQGTDYTSESMMLEKVRMVIVTDFYEEGAPFPFTAAEAGRLRLWVRSRFEEGKGVSFLSDAALQNAVSWWPAGFLGQISGSTVAYPV